MNSLLVTYILQTEKWTSPELFETKNRIYTFLNPVSYLIALENKSLFEQFDGIFADGSLLVSAIRLVYGKRVTRRSFDMTSLAPELLNYLMESRKTLYIVASGQEQVECSVRIFQEQYPKLRIAGFRNGYFSSDAVTKMVNIGEDVIQLPLSKGADYWAEYLGNVKYELSRQERCERNTELITKAGYNIETEAENLMKIYKNL